MQIFHSDNEDIRASGPEKRLERDLQDDGQKDYVFPKEKFWRRLKEVGRKSAVESDDPITRDLLDANVLVSANILLFF